MKRRMFRASEVQRSGGSDVEAAGAEARPCGHQGCSVDRSPGQVDLGPNLGRLVLGCIDADFCNDMIPEIFTPHAFSSSFGSYKILHVIKHICDLQTFALFFAKNCEIQGKQDMFQIFV